MVDPTKEKKSRTYNQVKYYLPLHLPRSLLFCAHLPGLLARRRMLSPTPTALFITTIGCDAVSRGTRIPNLETIRIRLRYCAMESHRSDHLCVSPCMFLIKHHSKCLQSLPKVRYLTKMPTRVVTAKSLNAKEVQCICYNALIRSNCSVLILPNQCGSLLRFIVALAVQFIFSM